MFEPTAVVEKLIIACMIYGYLSPSFFSRRSIPFFDFHFQSSRVYHLISSIGLFRSMLVSRTYLWLCTPSSKFYRSIFSTRYLLAGCKLSGAPGKECHRKSSQDEMLQVLNLLSVELFTIFVQEITFSCIFICDVDAFSKIEDIKN